SDSTPFTRTRTGTTVPAGPGGGEKVTAVPASPTLNWPGPGDAAVSVRATAPASISVAPETKPVPGRVSGPAPVRTGPSAGGLTRAAMLTGVEPLLVAPGWPGLPLPTRSW